MSISSNVLLPRFGGRSDWKNHFPSRTIDKGVWYNEYVKTFFKCDKKAGVIFAATSAQNRDIPLSKSGILVLAEKEQLFLLPAVKDQLELLEYKETCRRF